MRQLLVACIAGALVVGTAHARQLRIFFDSAGVGEQQDRGNVDPLSYGNTTVAVTGDPERLYIYGELLEENNFWLALMFDISADGDVKLNNPTIYDHLTENGHRWTRGVGELIHSQRARFFNAWIGNQYEYSGAMWNWDEAKATKMTGDPFNAADSADHKHYRRAWDSGGGGLGTTLLGYIDVEGSEGSLWLTVEFPLIARLGGSREDPVYFGYGDDPVTAGSAGIRTDIADATIVPEPAGWVLLGLGGLALRRRH